MNFFPSAMMIWKIVFLLFVAVGAFGNIVKRADDSLPLEATVNNAIARIDTLESSLQAAEQKIHTLEGRKNSMNRFKEI